MRTVRVVIPGDWADGWMYKETIILWDRSGHLFEVKQSDLRHHIASVASPHEAVLCDYLLFRNDWKNSPAFESVMRLPQVRHALVATPPEEIEPFEPTLIRPIMREKLEGYLLDVEVYANRVFTSTTAGVFETRFNPDYPNDRSPLHRLSDTRAASIAARSGCLAVAGGDAGLLTKNIAFDEESSLDRKETSPLTIEDDYSERVQFASHHLLNYRGHDSPGFLRASVRKEPPAGRAKFETTVIEDFDRPLALDRPINQAIHSRSRVDVRDYDDESSSERELGSNHVVRGNSNYQLLVESEFMSQVVNVSAYHGRPVQVAPNVNYNASLDDVRLTQHALSVQGLASGFLLERFASSVVFTQSGASTLCAEPRIRLRTFPHSRRHNDCFLAVADDFVELVGFLDVE